MASPVLHKVPIDGGSVYKTARPIVPIVLCAAGALFWLFSERAYVTALTNDVYFSMFVCFVVVFAVGAMTLPSAFRRFEWFWGGSLACTFIYFAFMLLGLLMPLSTLRTFMQSFGATLTAPVEQSYANSCDFTVENVTNSLDIFIIGHSVGWFFKMLVFRDFKFTFLASAAWEIVEILFTHDLPNFAECWWDQWLLDVSICNLFGIIVAWALIPAFGMRRFNWFGSVFNHVDFNGNIIQKRSSKKSILFGGFIVVVAFFWNQLFEINSFYVKALLWLPVVTPFNFIRLILWMIVGNTTINQVYRWAFDTIPSEGIPVTTTFGSYAIYGISMITLEVSLYLTNYTTEFPNPIPEHIIQYWIYIGIVAVILLIIFLIKVMAHKAPSIEHGSHQDMLRPSPLAFAPLTPFVSGDVDASKQTLEDLEVSDIAPLMSQTSSQKPKTKTGGSTTQSSSSERVEAMVNVIVGMSPSVNAFPMSPVSSVGALGVVGSSETPLSGLGITNGGFATPGLTGGFSRTNTGSGRRTVSQISAPNSATGTSGTSVVPRFTRGSLAGSGSSEASTRGSSRARDGSRAPSKPREMGISSTTNSRESSTTRGVSRSRDPSVGALRQRASGTSASKPPRTAGVSDFY